MLKDAFNRKQPKKEPDESSLTQGVPTVAQNEDGEAGDGDSETSATDAVVTTQQLASMTLQRLIETYQPEPEQPAEPVEQAPMPPANVMEFAAHGAQAAPCELSGQTINHLYLIEGLLAKGGMGQVLLATHLQRNIPVVMKLMLREADAGDMTFQRFMQECRVTSRLRHPNLVKVLDYGILLDGFKPYLVMEFVEGESLRQILRKRFAILPSDMAKVLTQVCSGLFEVHGKGIIHRDLKPENIMLRGVPDNQDNVKILDFGIAQLQKDKRFDEEGWAIGSIGYMSPEQVCGQPVDLRTDMYSVGLIFYEAITGKSPFRGRNAKETMAMHVKAPVVPPSQIIQCENAELVDRICLTSLAKDPAERYQDANELRADLERLLP